MNSHVLMIAGPAGCGKDTTAAMLSDQFNGRVTLLAQADPMKRLARLLFGFSEQQLWGPSQYRNADDPRFQTANLASSLWMEAQNIILTAPVTQWLNDLKRHGACNGELESMRESLLDWIQNVRHQANTEGALSPRTVLQTLGTEFGRSLDQNVWSNMALSTAFMVLGGGWTYRPIDGLVRDQAVKCDVAIITDGRFRNEIINVHRMGGLVIKVENPHQHALEAGVAGHVSETELASIPAHFFNAILYNDKTKGMANLQHNVMRLFRVMFRPLHIGDDFLVP